MSERSCKMKNSAFRCCVCTNNSPLDSYFKFPKKNSTRQKWLSFFEFNANEVNPYSRVCSHHFTEDDYVSHEKANGRITRFLKKKKNPSPTLRPTKVVLNRKSRYHRCFLCGKNDGEGGRCYFNFPVRNEAICRQWASFCDIPLNKVLRSYCLCSDHFRPQDINGNTAFGQRRRLNDDAVPRIRDGQIIDTGVEMDSETVTQPITPTTLQCTPNRESLHVEDITVPIIRDGEILNNGAIEMEIESETVTQPITPTTSQCTTNQASVDQVLPNTPPCKPKRLGDVCTPHVATPNRAKKVVSMAREEIAEKNKVIRAQRQTIKRLQDQITTYKEIVAHLKEKNLISENAQAKLAECMPESLMEIIQRIQEPVQAKYSPELRTFALTLRFYSARAYDYVREVYGPGVLPAPSTIRKWYSVVNGAPGFSEESFLAIALFAKEAGHLPVSLVADEMSIRQQLLYKNGKQYGQVNLGTSMMTEESDNAPEAKNALVFMAVSLKKGWKMPVGYFLIDGMTAAERANLMKICISKLHESNADVKNITYDGTSVNIAMAEILGANFEYGTANFKPWFNHPETNENVYAIPDPSHMLKLARNTLGESVYLIDGENKRISWNDVCLLQVLQEKEGLKVGTKLNKKHINYDQDVMSVRLAAQTLSKSVSDGFAFAKGLKLPEFQDCDGTAKFCLMINNAFDILNCRSNCAETEFKAPIMEPTMHYLTKNAKDIIDYIKKLKICVERKSTVEGVTTLKYEIIDLLHSKRKTGFIGFICALTNVFKIFEALRLKGQGYLLTYKLSQDHLESFFGAVRSRGGHNNNPNCYQFEVAYRSLIIHNEVRGSQNGNISTNDDLKVLHISCPSAKKSTAKEGSCIIAEEENDEAIVDDVEAINTEMIDGLSNGTIENAKKNKQKDPSSTLSIYNREVVKYISGFVARSLRKKLKKCPTCQEAIVSSDRKVGGLLLNVKDRGRLTVPSEDVIIICLAVEQIFREMLPPNFTEAVKNEIRKCTMNEVSTLVFNTMECQSNHKNGLIQSVTNLYYNIRVHHELECRSIKKKYIRRTMSKLILFSNE